MSPPRFPFAGLLALGVAAAPVAAIAGSGRMVTAPTPPSGQASPNAQTFKQQFMAANTTHDGRLTLDQAKAGGMTQIARNFDAIDVQHNGYVTLEDIRKYRAKMQTARSAPPPTKQ